MPRTIRFGGLTELVGDIVLTCVGGPHLVANAPIPTVNITVSFATTVTNRIVAGGRTIDSLLLIDEPGSGLPPVVPGFGPDAPQIPCIAGDGRTVGAGPGGCTQFAGAGPVPTAVFAPGASRPGANLFIGTANDNQVVFNGVPILPPAGTARILRINNIRVNTSALGGAGTPVKAAIAISSSTALPVSNPLPTVGIVTAALSTAVRTADSSDSLPADGASFAACAAADIAPVAVLQFREGFAGAFRSRVLPSVTQNIPGFAYNTESGFVTYAFGDPVGLADYGTRLRAAFHNVPPGVHLFVSVTNLAAGTALARLIGGEPVPDANGITGVAEIPVVNGEASAVWEVVNTNPAAVETLQFSVWVSYPADTAGAATVSLSLASSTASLAIPRFTDTSQPLGIFAISACQTLLLFPYVTSQSGFDTGLVIANTSQDPFGTSPQTGSCVLNWYGDKPHLPSKTADIAAGAVYTGSVSDLLNDEFTGYVIARCGFPLAHGAAFVRGTGLSGTMVDYLALVIATGKGSPRAAVSSGEGLLH